MNSVEPYVDGKPHGTAYQWHEGKLVNSYHMENGTGWDVWKCPYGSQGVNVSEARQYVDGNFHGPEWWINDDQESVHRERHFWEFKVHGIEREWNLKGGLRRGYPKYWIHGVQVDKRKYLRAAAKDMTLPPFRIEDNLPQRTFPPEVAKHLNPPSIRKNGSATEATAEP